MASPAASQAGPQPHQETTMTTIAPGPVAHAAAPQAPAPDFTAIKTRQQATWASGDYAVVAATLAIVAESLCEAVDLAAGEDVLDVAAGGQIDRLAQGFG